MDEKLLVKARELLERIREKRRELQPLLDEALDLEREIDKSLLRTCEKIRCDWVMFRYAPSSKRTGSLPYAKAMRLQEAGKGQVVAEFEKIYEKRWHVEPDPIELDQLRAELAPH